MLREDKQPALLTNTYRQSWIHSKQTRNTNACFQLVVYGHAFTMLILPILSTVRIPSAHHGTQNTALSKYL